MLLNVLARAANTIRTIIAHPIAFLGNLVDAGKLGFTNFVGRIGEDLKQGFMEWLFVPSPRPVSSCRRISISLGILSLVIQVFGLTYPNIRSPAVKTRSFARFALRHALSVDLISMVWDISDTSSGPLSCTAFQSAEVACRTRIIPSGTLKICCDFRVSA